MQHILKTNWKSWQRHFRISNDTEKIWFYLQNLFEKQNMTNTILVFIYLVPEFCLGSMSKNEQIQ